MPIKTDYRQWLLASGLVFGSLTGHAYELSYGIYGQATSTDNSTRVAEDEESDIEAEIGGSLRLFSTDGGRLRYDIDYDARHLRFIDDTDSDETSLDGRSIIEGYIVPELFSWNFIHRQTNTTTSAQDPDVPDNRERRITVQTGPSLYLRPTSVDIVQLSAAGSRTYFEETEESDTERVLADVAWNHQFNPITTARLFTQAGSVEFVNLNTDANDYDFIRYGVGVARQLSDWSWTFDVGGNTIDRNEGDNVNGLFFNGSANYQLGRSNLALEASREITDNSIGLGANNENTVNFDAITAPGADGQVDNQQLDVGDNDNNFNQQDVVERSRVAAIWTYNFSRSNLFVRSFYDHQDFEEIDNDQTQYGIGANWLVNLSFRSSVGADVSWNRRDFDNPIPFPQQTRTIAGVSYNYDLSEFWTVSSRVSHSRLTREDAGDALTPVDETRFQLRLDYFVE